MRLLYHALPGKIKQMSKSNEISPRNKVALELLHHIIGHRSTRSLMAVDYENVWQDIEIRIYPYPFYTTCKRSSKKKG